MISGFSDSFLNADASKCRQFDNNKIWYLTIEADVSDRFIEELDTKLKSLN